MPKKDNSGVLLGVLGALALGVVLSASGSSGAPTDPRGAFVARLRAALAAQGVGLLSAELGYDQAKQASVWVLGLKLPDQSVTTVNAAVVVGAPMSPQACDDIAQRVAAWVREQSA